MKPTKTQMKKLGQSIAERRIAAGLDPQQFARVSGVARSTTTPLELGEVRGVTLGVLCRIASGLRCTVIDLLTPAGV